jgi:hypothetical protein
LAGSLTADIEKQMEYFDGIKLSGRAGKSERNKTRDSN